MKSLSSVDLKGKVIGVRVDLNVPLQNGVVQSDNRIRAVLPTLEFILKSDPKRLLVFSHLGRPEGKGFEPEFSLEPIAKVLEKLLGQEVTFDRSYLEDSVRNAVNSPEDFKVQGKVILMENTRMLKGEKKNDPELSKRLAKFMDVFVMDAFATSHRAESTTTGVTEFAKEACAGLLLQSEVEALSKASEHPARPLLSVVGGSKVSTKLPILERLAELSDSLIVGGGMANTFLLAQGQKVGKSLAEPELVNTAKEILKRAKVLLPTDVVVAKEISDTAATRTIPVSQIADDEMILDFGPETMKAIDATIQSSKTILLNGPVGVFELKPFEAGTRALLESIAKSSAFSVAGGGDTVSAVEKFKVSDKISYISTAGGAFLEFIQGLELPALAALKKRG